MTDARSSNLWGPEFVRRAAQAILYLLDNEEMRPLLADAQQQLHSAGQNLRYALISEVAVHGSLGALSGHGSMTELSC